ncbi:MAG: hypothetical protein RL328_1058 [Acidobacteriota bacterium]
MKKLIALLALSSVAAFATTYGGQNDTTQTTTSAAVSATGSVTEVCVASATNINTPAATRNGTYLGIDQEAFQVTGSGSSATCFKVKGGQLGTARAGHASGANVWVGNTATGSGDSSRPFSGGAIIASAPAGTCTASAQYSLPVVVYGANSLMNVTNGTAYICGANGRWGKLKSFWVAPTNCTFAPTTLTTTNTYPQVGNSTLFVLNGTTNAATGTLTLTCNFYPSALINTSSPAVLQDIVAFYGSQTTAPSALGTPTLGSITFPAVATSETASTVAPVAAGGTITKTQPSQITSTTTAGSYLSVGYTFASAVALNGDSKVFQFTQPFTNGSAAAMTINTPGLLVHYVEER